MPYVRTHPLLQVPVIFAPERSRRPQPAYVDKQPASPHACPFCPGFEHETPPDIYRHGAPDWSLRLFPNKYPIVDSTAGGAHEVLVETRTHEEPLDSDTLETICTIYRERMRALLETHLYVTIFKNRGRWGGESISHPHSQILALPFIPPRVDIELSSFQNAAACPMCAAVSSPELAVERRGAVVICLPPVPRFANELWIAPLRHENRFDEASDGTLRDVSSALSLVLRMLNDTPIARSWNWGVMTAPADDAARSFHWYIEIVPRATALAGFELQSGAYVNSVPPEESFAKYRAARERYDR